MAGLRMALDCWLAGDRRLLPKYLAGATIEAVNDETVFAFVVDGFDVAIEAELNG